MMVAGVIQLSGIKGRPVKTASCNITSQNFRPTEPTESAEYVGAVAFARREPSLMDTAGSRRTPEEYRQ